MPSGIPVRNVRVESLRVHWYEEGSHLRVGGAGVIPRSDVGPVAPSPFPRLLYTADEGLLPVEDPFVTVPLCPGLVVRHVRAASRFGGRYPDELFSTKCRLYVLLPYLVGGVFVDHEAPSRSHCHEGRGGGYAGVRISYLLGDDRLAEPIESHSTVLLGHRSHQESLLRKALGNILGIRISRSFHFHHSIDRHDPLAPIPDAFLYHHLLFG